MYLKTVSVAEATDRIAEIYSRSSAERGFVMAATRCWTVRPDVLPVYEAFLETIRGKFSLGMRAWRLITFIAAKEVPSTYCSHVYSKALLADLGSKEAVLALQRDFRHAGLGDKEVAMPAYAQQIARDASKIGEDDIDTLRRTGFSDVQISDIALCASFRCFVSRYFDAVGAGPEAVFIDDDSAFRTAMTIGKAVELA